MKIQYNTIDLKPSQSQQQTAVFSIYCWEFKPV